VIAPEADAGRAAQWKSGHVALFAGAAAFVAAFSLTIALSASGGSRQPQAARAVRAATHASAPSVRVPAQQPSEVSFDPIPAPAITTGAPKTADSAVVPSAKRPPRRKAVRDNERAAAERRYGI
jgi:hypothetical protein